MLKLVKPCDFFLKFNFLCFELLELFVRSGDFSGDYGMGVFVYSRKNGVKLFVKLVGNFF